MYLKRQSDSVPRETTVSGTDSALSARRLHAREHHSSCQRQRQTMYLSYLLIVTSLCFQMVRFSGLIRETTEKNCRDIIMSLWTQTERMTEQGITPRGKYETAGRDSLSSKTKHCQGRTFISFLVWDYKRVPNCQFHVRSEDKEAKRGLLVFSVCLSMHCGIYVLVSTSLFTCCQVAGIQRWQGVIIHESYTADQVLEISEHMAGAEVWSYRMCSWLGDTLYGMAKKHHNYLYLKVLCLFSSGPIAVCYNALEM